MLPGWKMRLVSSNGLSVTTKKLAVSGWCVKQWWSVLLIPTVLALNPGWAISWLYDLRQAHYLVWFYLFGGIVRAQKVLPLMDLSKVNRPERIHHLGSHEHRWFMARGQNIKVTRSLEEADSSEMEQDPVVIAPWPYPLHAFGLWKL